MSNPAANFEMRNEVSRWRNCLVTDVDEEDELNEIDGNSNCNPILTFEKGARR